MSEQKKYDKLRIKHTILLALKNNHKKSMLLEGNHSDPKKNPRNNHKYSFEKKLNKIKNLRLETKVEKIIRNSSFIT